MAVFSGFWTLGTILEALLAWMAGTGSKQIGQTSDKREKSRKKKTRTIELEATRLPPIIPSSSLLSHTTSHHVLNTSLPQSRPKDSQPQLHNTASQPQPRLEVSQPQLHNIESHPQSNQFQPTNTLIEPMMSPPTNATPATSCTVVGDDNDDNRVWIVPEADGFDPHKPVITGIANCIRSKFELARPSWKKYPQSTRDMWFDEFKKKFRWLPHHTDAIRRNFEKRAAAKMTQLFQDIREDLTVKPEWIGEAVFKEMKEYWESPEYKAKSEQNKKNCEVNAGASVHTGGCIPHRLIYKRMNNFAQKKEELLASQSTPVEGETNSTRQPSQVSDIDIWMMFVGGKKKGRVAGLGSLGRAIRAPTQSTSAMPEEVNEIIKSQVQDSTDKLYNQLQEERRQNKEMRRQNKKNEKGVGCHK